MSVRSLRCFRRVASENFGSRDWCSTATLSNLAFVSTISFRRSLNAQELSIAMKCCGLPLGNLHQIGIRAMKILGNASTTSYSRVRIISVVFATFLLASCGVSPASGGSSTTTNSVTSTTLKASSTTEGSTTTTVAAPPSPCRSSDLAVTFGGGGAGLGHVSTTLLFWNVSKTTCTLYGYPGVAGLNSSGKQEVQALRTKSGYLGGLRGQSSKLPLTTLAPGRVASAIVEGTDVPVGAATSCPTYSALLVTPPNTKKSTNLTEKLPGCSRIQVHPVVSGGGGNYVATGTGTSSPKLGQPIGIFFKGSTGFGSVKPAVISNGGDPTGTVSGISWSSWGRSQAVGIGKSDYVGPNQSVASGTQETARVVAFDLGTCGDVSMYRAVEWYFPSHGQHFSATHFEDICTGQYYPLGLGQYVGSSSTGGSDSSSYHLTLSGNPLNLQGTVTYQPQGGATTTIWKFNATSLIDGKIAYLSLSSNNLGQAFSGRWTSGSLFINSCDTFLKAPNTTSKVPCAYTFQ